MATSSHMVDGLALALHIGGAATGLVAGAAAFCLRKGGIAHRLSGQIFAVAMLLMASSAVFLAVRKAETDNLIVGSFTFYLVATGWMVARPRDAQPAHAHARRFASGAVVAALCIAAVELTRGLRPMLGAHGDVAAGAGDIVFGCVAGLAAVGDWKLATGRSLQRSEQLARHLWRMGVAMLIATASFFLGKQQHFPHALRGSPVLFVPVLAVLGATLFWLLRLACRAGSGGMKHPPLALTLEQSR